MLSLEPNPDSYSNENEEAIEKQYVSDSREEDKEKEEEKEEEKEKEKEKEKGEENEEEKEEESKEEEESFSKGELLKKVRFHIPVLSLSLSLPVPTPSSKTSADPKEKKVPEEHWKINDNGSVEEPPRLVRKPRTRVSVPKKALQKETAKVEEKEEEESRKRKREETREGKAPMAEESIGDKITKNELIIEEAIFKGVPKAKRAKSKKLDIFKGESSAPVKLFQSMEAEERYKM